MNKKITKKDFEGAEAVIKRQFTDKQFEKLLYLSKQAGYDWEVAITFYGIYILAMDDCTIEELKGITEKKK